VVREGLRVGKQSIKVALGDIPLKSASDFACNRVTNKQFLYSGIADIDSTEGFELLFNKEMVIEHINSHRNFRMQNDKISDDQDDYCAAWGRNPRIISSKAQNHQASEIAFGPTQETG
jgi:hypothetical protein